MNLKKTTLAAIVGICLSTSAVADRSLAIIERCKQTTSDSDRIVCLEAAILMQAGGAVPEPPATAPDADSAKALPDDEPVETPPPTTAEAAPALADEEPEESTVIPEETVATGIGAEQVIARQQTQEEMLAALAQETGLRVAKYETVPYQKLQVTLENGQVWRQIKGDTQKLNVNLRKNQTVDISESSISGYKLRLNEMRRTVRVQRIR